MSNQDHEGADWHLGMELPSRKETHGRKKKSDRKERKEQKREVAPQVELPAAPPAAHSAEERSAEEGSAEAQWQAYRDEVAATAAIPMPTTESEFDAPEVTPRDSNGLAEDEQYLRDLIFGENGQAVVGDVAEVGDDAAYDDAARATEAVTDTTDTDTERKTETGSLEEAETGTMVDADVEEDDSPVIAKWKVALFFLFAPLLLIAVLAYGKLAYVHQVPDFVRQHVPAYQSGEGFLILKPWWFGPPIFDLKAYPMEAGEEYSQWQLQLSDYAGVVQDPTVLYTFPQDILQSK